MRIYPGGSFERAAHADWISTFTCQCTPPLGRRGPAETEVALLQLSAHYYDREYPYHITSAPILSPGSGRLPIGQERACRG
jgi:hypothetical protein